MEEVLKYIAEHWPLLLLLIIVAVAAWKLSQLYSEWRHRMKHVEGECKKVNDEVMPTLRNVEASTKNISKTIMAPLVYLKGKDGAFDSSLFQSHSPMTLTALGSEILDASGGKK